MNQKIRDLIYSAGGRKFILGLIVCFWFKGLDAFLLWQGKLSEEGYVELGDIILWLILGLFTANVATKAFDFRKVPTPGVGEVNEDEDERDKG